MHTTNLRKIGGSVMLAVPPAVLKMLQLQPGAAVDVTVADGRLLIEPIRQKRYSLKELLAQCNVEAPQTVEDNDWISSAQAGRELI
jgi:antitoxin ChpS